MSKRIAPKETFLHSATPPEPGKHSVSARWAELSDAPLVREAVEKAFAEYAARQVPDPTMPGKMAYQIHGAREVLDVLLNLGEPTKPVIKGETVGLKPT